MCDTKRGGAYVSYTLVVDVCVIVRIYTFTYLLNPLRAEVHISPTPERATAVYLLKFSRDSHRSGYALSFLTPPFFSRFLPFFLSPVFHLVEGREHYVYRGTFIQQFLAPYLTKKVQKPRLVGREQLLWVSSSIMITDLVNPSWYGAAHVCPTHVLLQ